MQSHPEKFSHFSLPKIHPSIPPKALLIQGEISHFAKQLIQIGIIKVAELPNRLSSASEIVSFGLSKWFTEHLGQLNAVKFGVCVVPATRIEEMIEFFEHDDSFVVGSNPYIEFESDGEEPFHFIKPAFDFFESTCPGLMHTALCAISNASARTIEVRLPSDFLHHFANWHWEDGGWGSFPTDEEELANLSERFDGDKDRINESLPSTILAKLGGIAILPSHEKSAPKEIPLRRMKLLSTTHQRKSVREFAGEVHRLMTQFKHAEKEDIWFPKLDGLYTCTITTACCIAYDNEDFVRQQYDSIRQDLWNNGDGIETFGFREFPKKPLELSEFFAQLLQGIELLKQMDKVISLLKQTKFK